MVAGLSSLGTVVLELSASNWLQVLGMKHSPEQTPTLSLLLCWINMKESLRSQERTLKMV